MDRLRAPTTTSPPARENSRVHNQQRRMKERFDVTRRVKTPAFAPLDWVRVRRPHRAHKLRSFWSAPVQITDQLGPATYRLSDGSRWHASRLRRVPPPAIGGQQETPPTTTGMWANDDSDFATGEVNLPPVHLPAPDPPVLPAPPMVHPARVRVQPEYLKDYVTDF